VIPGVIQWGELPVPYVAAWSSETAAYVARDAVIGNRPAIHRSGRRGDGRPVFGKMNERRTRRVVVEHRCQVCADPLRGEGFVIDIPYARTVGGDPLVMEPPSCDRCFRVALSLCPGIARLEGKRRLLVARVRDYVPYLVTIDVVDNGGTPDIQAALLAWRGDKPVVGYVRPALTEYDVLSFDEVRRRRSA
jgi:hypothetical protein